MPIVVNIQHLEKDNVKLSGRLPSAELDIDTRDEMVQLRQPLEYELEVQMLEGGLLAQGRLRLELDCRCVRCLESFHYQVQIAHWICHLPLQGEDKVSVVNDCVDLTPCLREDMLLEFPQHPLCERGCCGVYSMRSGKAKTTSDNDAAKAKSPVWAELDKLKLRN